MPNFVITNTGDMDTDGNAIPSTPITLKDASGNVVSVVQPGTCFGWLVTDGPVTLSTG